MNRGKRGEEREERGIEKRGIEERGIEERGIEERIFLFPLSSFLSLDAHPTI